MSHLDKEPVLRGILNCDDTSRRAVWGNASSGLDSVDCTQTNAGIDVWYNSLSFQVEPVDSTCSSGTLARGRRRLDISNFAGEKNTSRGR